MQSGEPDGPPLWFACVATSYSAPLLTGSHKRNHLRRSLRIVVDDQLTHLRGGVGWLESHGSLAALAFRQRLLALSFDRECKIGRAHV